MRPSMMFLSSRSLCPDAWMCPGPPRSLSELSYRFLVTPVRISFEISSWSFPLCRVLFLTKMVASASSSALTRSGLFPDRSRSVVIPLPKGGCSSSLVHFLPNSTEIECCFLSRFYVLESSCTPSVPNLLLLRSYCYLVSKLCFRPRDRTPPPTTTSTPFLFLLPVVVVSFRSFFPEIPRPPFFSCAGWELFLLLYNLQNNRRFEGGQRRCDSLCRGFQDNDFFMS